MSGAVANLSTLSEYCIPFVKVGGNFISYKSGDCDEEINSSKAAIKKIDDKILSFQELFVPLSANIYCTMSIN